MCSTMPVSRSGIIDTQIALLSTFNQKKKVDDGTFNR